MFMMHLIRGLWEDVTPPKVVTLNFHLKQVSTSNIASQLKKNAKEIIAWEVARGRHHDRSVKDRSLECPGLGGVHMGPAYVTV